MKKNMFSSFKKLSTNTIVILIGIIVVIAICVSCYFSPLQEGATSNNTCKVRIITVGGGKLFCKPCAKNKKKLRDFKHQYNGTTINGKYINVDILDVTRLTIKQKKEFNFNDRKKKVIPAVVAVLNNKVIYYKGTDYRVTVLSNWLKSICM